MNGRVEAIWIKRAKRGPMDAANRVNALENKGIETDANFGRSRRQVTVIEREVFDRIRAALPAAEPSMRRANVMVSGLRLRQRRGQVLRLGDVLIKVMGETRPCERMDEQCPGLTAALDPDWRGGVFGIVLAGGQFGVGDEARFEPDPETP